MKIIGTMGAQGDCLFRRIPTLPEGAGEEQLSGRAILAHSETGHHHSIDDVTGVRFFRDPVNPLLCYLTLEGVGYADVVHHRSFDTHETLRLLTVGKQKTVFEVRRQREFVEQADRSTSWRPVVD